VTGEPEREQGGLDAQLVVGIADDVEPGDLGDLRKPEPHRVLVHTQPGR
jgi:hypothetical protein